jgi:ketosteroid isomerase-like protein
MSEDPNLAFLRDICAAWAMGDFTRADIFDPDVEFVTGGLEPRLFHGPEGVVEGWFDFLSAWEDFRVELREIIPGVRPETYVVFCHLSGRGKESGVPTESETANVIGIRDGRITRLELHWDRVAALESAGVAGTRP